MKEVKEKRLPELDDDFAVEAGGYDSLDELRAEIESRIAQAEERAIEAEFREAAVDAVVAQAKIEVPHELVHSKAHEMWHRTARRLAAQGVNPEQYLADDRQDRGGARRRVGARGRDRAQARGRAGGDRRGRGHRGLRRGDRAGAARSAPPDASDKQLKRALKRARSQGADEALREDIAMRKAVDLVVENAKPIDGGGGGTPPGARRAEKLWTPESAR